MSGFVIIFSTLALLVVIFGAAGLKIVQQSEVVIIERLGKYSRTLSSGINIIWPFVDRPRSIMWRYVMEAVDGRKLVNFKELNRIDLREDRL